MRNLFISLGLVTALYGMSCAAEGKSRLEQVDPINPYEEDLSEGSQDRTPAEHIRIARHYVSRSEYQKAAVSIEKAAEKLKIEADRAAPEKAAQYRDAAQAADRLGDDLANGRVTIPEPMDKLAAQVRDIQGAQ